jgi:ribosomal-protein-alanine N-acetyltransferase
VPAVPDPEGPPIAAPLGEVRTARLRLTPVGPGDATALTPVFAEREVWRFPYGRGMDAGWTAAFVERAVRHWERFGFGLWIARTLAEEQTIGYLGLSMPAFLAEIIPEARMPAVEVGWRLHPTHWGRSLATEGAQAALDEAFETLGLAEVCSVPQTANRASARVAERIGMRLERTATLAATDSRGSVEVDLYRITRATWLARG